MLTAVRKHMRIFKTGNLYFIFFVLAMSLAVMGPCLLDLQHTIHTDSHHIAIVYSCKSVAHLFGAILGGIVLDVSKSKQAMLFGFSAVATGAILGIPWSRNFETMAGIMFVHGLCLGGIETGGNVMCLNLWGKESTPVLQGQQFFFGLGSLLSPLIAAPFLGKFSNLSRTTRNATNLEDRPMNFADVPSPGNDNIASNAAYLEGNLSKSIHKLLIYGSVAGNNPRIIYPFSIVGAFFLLATILLLIACVISPTEEGDVQSEQAGNSERSVLFMFFAILVTFLLFTVSIGMQCAYSLTLTAYAVEGPLHTTERLGSYMTSVYWTAFTLSRLACVFLAMKIGIVVLMAANACIVAISALVLQFCMPNEWALWLASVLFGVGIAPWHANLFGYLNTHINVTSKIAAVFTVGVSVGELAVPFTVTYFIESNPEVFTLVVVASSALMPVLLFVLYCILRTGSVGSVVGRKMDCYVINGGKERERHEIDINTFSCFLRKVSVTEP